MCNLIKSEGSLFYSVGVYIFYTRNNQETNGDKTCSWERGDFLHGSVFLQTPCSKLILKNSKNQNSKIQLKYPKHRHVVFVKATPKIQSERITFGGGLAHPVAPLTRTKPLPSLLRTDFHQARSDLQPNSNGLQPIAMASNLRVMASNP